MVAGGVEIADQYAGEAVAQSFIHHFLPAEQSVFPDVHGEKKDLILMDNNLMASPRFSETIDEIVDLGFRNGATLARRVKRRVDFNQGVDAKILSKSPAFLQKMSRI